MTDLTAALAALAAAGQRTPCQGPGRDAWTAEERRIRRRAEVLCLDCPVRAACLAAAEAGHEAWHVWGGVDFTQLTRDRYHRNAA